MAERTRRDALRLAGALAATGATGFGGCNRLPFGAEPPPAYATWLTAPDEMTGPFDHYQFISLRPQAVADRRDSLSPEIVEVLESSPSYPGVERVAATERLVVRRRMAVVSGGFDRGDVVDELEGDGFEARGTVAAHALYARGDGTYVVGVGDETIVAPDREAGVASPQAAVESVLETDAGDRERYPDANGAVGDLVRRLGDDHHVLGGGHAADGGGFDGALASGFGFDFGASETTVRAVVVFEDGEADAGAVADWGAAMEFFFEGDVSTSTAGRTVTARVTRDTGDVTEFALFTPNHYARNIEW